MGFYEKLFRGTPRSSQEAFRGTHYAIPIQTFRKPIHKRRSTHLAFFLTIIGAYFAYVYLTH